MNYINALLLGLSTGVFCFSYCAPIYVPQILAQKDKLKGWSIFLQFNAGRLVSYVAFGTIFGALGLNRHAEFLKNYADYVMAILAIILILYGLGLSLPELKCASCAKKAQVPFLSGLLLGINICPPFLAALIYNFQEGGILNGIIFFLFFYIGTTIYLIPVTFLGFLADKKIIREAARLAAVIVGLIMLVQIFI